MAISTFLNACFAVIKSLKRAISSVLVLFSPFSAFLELGEVVNRDEAIAHRRFSMLICTSEGAVTTNI